MAWRETVHMKEVGTNRSSGASLALVGFAIAATAAYGAYAKRTERDGRNFVPIEATFDFKLRLLEKGIGICPIPTAPPAAAWLKFELYGAGKAIHHRPVQFRKRAWDSTGRALLAEHRWHEGFFYAFVRSGFRKSEGPVTLQINFRDRPVETLKLDPLPQPTRVLQAVATKPAWKGLSLAVVRMPKDAQTPLALRVDAPLGPDEAVAVERLGSTYLEREPYNVTWFAKAGTVKELRPVPLNLGYPADGDAVLVRIRHLRAVRHHGMHEFGLRYSGVTGFNHLYSLRPDQASEAGGMMLALGRFDRSVAILKDGTQPIRLFLTARNVVARSWARLISPTRIHGAPLMLGNRIWTSENRSDVLPSLMDQNDARPTEVDETIPIRIETEVWAYETVAEETLVVPYNYRRLPIFKGRKLPPLIFLND